jgi:hypothetical protein
MKVEAHDCCDGHPCCAGHTRPTVDPVIQVIASSGWLFAEFYPGQAEQEDATFHIWQVSALGLTQSGWLIPYIQ